MTEAKQIRTDEDILRNYPSHTYPTGHSLSNIRFFDDKTVLDAMEESRREGLSEEEITDAYQRGYDHGYNDASLLLSRILKSPEEYYNKP